MLRALQRQINGFLRTRDIRYAGRGCPRWLARVARSVRSTASMRWMRFDAGVGSALMPARKA